MGEPDGIARLRAERDEAIATCRPNLLVEFNRERMHNLGISIDESWRFLIDELGYRAFRVLHNGCIVALAEPGQFENMLLLNACESEGSNRALQQVGWRSQ